MRLQKRNIFSLMLTFKIYSICKTQRRLTAKTFFPSEENVCLVFCLVNK